MDTGRTQTYAYDNLQRLLTAQAQATSGVDCWGLSFGNGTNAADDPLGNLLNMSVAKCSGPSLSVSVNTSNRITNTGFSYDAAGNNTADGSYTYTYDAENRITSAAGVNYIYDGNDSRVIKSNGTLYWRSIWGDTIAESDLTGSTTNSNYHEYILFAGRRVARSDPSAAAVYYYFVDQLGSTRALTQANGTVCFSADYYPYGQELDYNTTCLQNYKFTGYERDTETGLDYAFNRYYNSRLGRFMSADPLAGSIADPQSLNRYTYVRNDPGNLIDPLGMTWECVWVRIANGDPQPMDCKYKDDDPWTLFRPNQRAGGDLGGGGDRGGGGSRGGTSGGTTTMSADPNGKKNYCSHQADLAALEELLPGITRGDYVSTASALSAETGAHLALEGAAASSVFKRAIRSRTGIAMSTTSKWLGRIATTALLVSGYLALRAAQEEYQGCMNY